MRWLNSFRKKKHESLTIKLTLVKVSKTQQKIPFLHEWEMQHYHCSFPLRDVAFLDFEYICGEKNILYINENKLKIYWQRILKNLYSVVL